MKLVPENGSLPALPAVAVALLVPGPFTLLVEALRTAALMDGFSPVRPVMLFSGNQVMRRAGIAVEALLSSSASIVKAPARAMRYRALPDNILRFDLRPRPAPDTGI